MATDENSGWPLACFFQLLLKPQFDLQKLEIPTKFMRTYGNDLSEIIFLNTPTGKVWKIKLVRENGIAFLQNGWSEFVEFNLVSYGYGLLFKYKGNSRFTVIILDPTASEIEYSLDPEASTDSPSKKRKSIDHLKQSMPTKKGKIFQNIMDDIKLIISQNKSCKKGFTNEEINRVRAYADHNCHKPSFATKMQLSCVASKHMMSIPKEFVRRYLDCKPCAFNLQTADAMKNWPVGTGPCTQRMRLCVGWKTFALDNKLRVRDICIFELVRKQELKVHILRAACC